MRDLVLHRSGLVIDFAQADFGGPAEASVVNEWLGGSHRSERGEFTCYQHRDRERPWLYLQQRGALLVAAHWPGTALAGSHEIHHGVSDEHQRQVDYIGRAGEAAGFDVGFEVRLPTKVVPDAVIYGRAVTIGVEVQHSGITRTLARARTTKARRAGINSVWFADRADRAWLYSVPSIGMNPEVTWARTPNSRSVTVVSGVKLIIPTRCRAIPNSPCPDRRYGCNAWHAIHQPRTGLFVDDVASMMPAGELVPMQYRRFSGAKDILIVSQLDKTRYEQMTGRSADLPALPIRTVVEQDLRRASCQAGDQTIGTILADTFDGAPPACCKDRALILACQLCPQSPTYWRTTGVVA